MIGSETDKMRNIWHPELRNKDRGLGLLRSGGPFTGWEEQTFDNLMSALSYRWDHTDTIYLQEIHPRGNSNSPMFILPLPVPSPPTTGPRGNSFWESPLTYFLKSNFLIPLKSTGHPQVPSALFSSKQLLSDSMFRQRQAEIKAERRLAINFATGSWCE